MGLNTHQILDYSCVTWDWNWHPCKCAEESNTWDTHTFDSRRCAYQQQTYFVIRVFKSLSSPSSSSNLLVKVSEISVLASWLRALSLFGSFGSTAPSPKIKQHHPFNAQYTAAVLIFRETQVCLTVPSNISTSGTSPRSCSSSCSKSLRSGEMASRCSKSSYTNGYVISPAWQNF